jgi:hypothetical protein
MTGPRIRRFVDATPADLGWEDENNSAPLSRRPPSVSALRHDFATLVVRRLVDSEARVAVINDRGRAALVDCRERLFDLLAKDHPIIGVYRAGVRVRDVIDDLRAGGL